MTKTIFELLNEELSAEELAKRDPLFQALYSAYRRWNVDHILPNDKRWLPHEN
ncbi:MAG: hypothetical protein NT129_06585 [Candidatus Aenigmarchaeota archaeon]|nr:hypothetical protein [Candidatus Aenigmarchaeota archaeon]